MDRRERYPNDEETFRIGTDAARSRIWTALPGIVQSYNQSKMTVSVLPAINARIRNVDGTFSSLQMPLLLDCPVQWQGGGGATLTFPVKKGDECLVVFSARCIDAWWSSGQVSDPPVFRMHNLSDGFALIGVRSLPRAYAPPAGTAQLQSDDGSTIVQLDPNGKIVTIAAPGGINLNGVNIDSSGNVTNVKNLNATATITAATEVVAGAGATAIHLTTHKHPTAGTGAPSPPTPGT